MEDRGDEDRKVDVALGEGHEEGLLDGPRDVGDEEGLGVRVLAREARAERGDVVMEPLQRGQRRRVPLPEFCLRSPLSRSDRGGSG